MVCFVDISLPAYAAQICIAKLIALPASTPLAPMLSELTHALVDVLVEEPERLHTLDSGELRDDID